MTGPEDQEIVFAAVDIVRVETDEDGDLVVYGKASDAGVDSDNQIVDPAWMAKAASTWLDTGGNVRVQHNPQRDPAGKGVKVETDPTGATWVTSKVIEPIAKKLVSKGVLRAYSVGIARPTIVRDQAAPGGRITGGELVEISLVDRPANKRCGIQLVKSVDGVAEYTGELFGSKDDIQKALGVDSVKFTEGRTYEEAPARPLEVTGKGDMSFTFTPNDLAKMLRNKVIEEHYNELAQTAEKESWDHNSNGYDPFAYSVSEKRNFDPDVGGGVDRDKLNDSDFAGRHRSFPIVTQADVSDALHSIGRAGADNYDAETLRNRIHAIARRKGFRIPGEDNAGNKEAEPVVTKDPEDDTEKAAKKPKKGKKKLPPWLNQDDAQKCHTDPKTASGAEEPADMQPAPVGELVETPAPAHMKGQALLRYKTIGIDSELGILHDLLCPAFHPGEVAKYHPEADFRDIDEEIWQRKALNAATGSSIEQAMEAQKVWQAVVVLKNADQDDLLQYRLELYKAFRDANPGPTSFPCPGSISPNKYNRPLITDGHETASPGHSGPNSSAQVATGAPNARHFDKPPLSAGHQSPSPSFMKNAPWGEYPQEQGVPTRIDYSYIEKEKARRALSMVHDHLIHGFPMACPMLDLDAYRGDHPTALNSVTGVSGSQTSAVKLEDSATGEVLGDVYKYIRKLEKKVRLGELTEAQARDKLSKKTARKYAEDLARQVEKGLTSKNEVLKALGVEMPTVAKTIPADAQIHHAPATPDPVITSGLTPDVMKSMMAEILRPLEERLEAQTAHITEQEKLLGEYQEKFGNQQKELQEHRSRWDALANKADPSTDAFAGLAFNPVKKAAPAGVVKQADMSEKVQGMMMRQLERAWRTSENPAEREAAYAALMKYKGME